jgi:kynurenine formamidase
MTIPDLQRFTTFDLERPRTNHDVIHPGHVPPGYSYVLHRHHGPASERRTSAAGVVTTSEHAGTHIDAFSHQALDLKLYGDRSALEAQTSFGFRELGIDTLPPLLCRGVLIDLARHRGEPVDPGRWIALDEVREAAEAQGVTPREGDVALIRTGNGAAWSDHERYLRGSGMSADVSTWLADQGVRAVGADNVAWDWTGEPCPKLGVTLPGHVILLVQRGVSILENLDLEGLAGSGASEFLFIGVPLKLVGATASPIRPLALVPPS